MSPGQTHSAGTRKTRVSGSPDDAASHPHPQAGSWAHVFPAGPRLGSPGAEHPPSPGALPSGPG